MFRESFTELVDKPKVKKGFACLFIASTALSFGLGYLAGDRYRASYCHSHDCGDTSIDNDATLKAVGIGLSVLAFNALFVFFTALTIFCCHVDDKKLGEHSHLLQLRDPEIGPTPDDTSLQ